jgi:hypothetical protein
VLSSCLNNRASINRHRPDDGDPYGISRPFSVLEVPWPTYIAVYFVTSMGAIVRDWGDDIYASVYHEKQPLVSSETRE